jgi:arginase
MERLDGLLRDGTIPVVLGGDHSVSIATVSAVSCSLREAYGEDANTGVVWIDAHPDLESPGPESTNDLNAMAAAHLLNHGLPELCTLGGFAPKVRPENVAFVGLRDVVPEEKQLIHDLGIASYTGSDIERLGISAICDAILEQMNAKTDGVVVSFDMDAVDPTMAPGVDYPVPGGLTAREAMVIAEAFAKFEKLKLVELLEVNPVRDTHDTTARLAALWIGHVIGGAIL